MCPAHAGRPFSCLLQGIGIATTIGIVMVRGGIWTVALGAGIATMTAAETMTEVGWS